MAIRICRCPIFDNTWIRLPHSWRIFAGNFRNSCSIPSCGRIGTSSKHAVASLRQWIACSMSSIPASGVFDAGARDMWMSVSAERFRRLKKLVVANHEMIGGTLCGLTGSIDAWAEKFSNENVGGPARRAEYIRNELRQGMDNIRNIRMNGKKPSANG